jgi:DNA invertase Pin-like site-specific DNA recombinase
MSRLARSGKDWYQLIELCALSGAVLADTDGVYDPAEYNDRLLLGLKGTMSGATRGRTMRVSTPVGGSMAKV